MAGTEGKLTLTWTFRLKLEKNELILVPLLVGARIAGAIAIGPSVFTHGDQNLREFVNKWAKT